MRKHKKMSRKEKFEFAMIIFVLIIAFGITGWLRMDDGQCDKFEKTIVEIQTNKGLITAEVYNKEVPTTVENFLTLVKDNFYDGLTFHRYEPGFVIQGGDPKGDGTGGSDKTIPLEISPNLKHEKGVLAMARANDPDSASSQFYITLATAPFLDGKYAVFGKVLEGMDVVLDLRADDVIESIKVTKQFCE